MIYILNISKEFKQICPNAYLRIKTEPERTLDYLRSIDRRLKRLDVLQYHSRADSTSAPSNLDNCISNISNAPEEANKNPMAFSRARVNMGNDFNGKPVYTQVSGKTQDERNDNIVRAYIQSGRIFDFLPDAFSALVPNPKIEPVKHGFTEYADYWYSVFSKPNVEASTAITYRRQLDLYWIPAFGDKPIEDITASDIQAVLNDMGDVSRDTRKKAMLVISMIFSQAVEDGYITRNISKSKTIKITGKAAKETEPYSIEQMQYLVAHIPDVNNPADRTYLAIAALHPLRPEEVFGLQYGDIDREGHKISILRSVTYLKSSSVTSDIREVSVPYRSSR